MLDDSQEDFTLIDTEDFYAPLEALNLPVAKVIPRTTTIAEVLSILRKNGYGSLIIGETQVEGIVTERDFLFKVSSNFEQMKDQSVETIMTPNPFTLKESSTIYDAIQLMSSREFRHIPIICDSQIKVISVSDLISYTLNYFKEDLLAYGTKVDWAKNGVYLQDHAHYSDETAVTGKISTRVFDTPLRKIMFKEALYCDMDKTLDEVVDLMKKNKSGNIIFLAYETELKGILTERDILKNAYGEVDFSTTLGMEYMTENPHKLLEQDLIAIAVNNMSKYKYRSVIVANQAGFPVSVVSILEILKFISSQI
ncbi:hypothetical protein A9Q84_12310 [Halobacteriovorax marinus]|uniref:CBS domain-containing protein n=1 Tax=Halobacteriovorax marinus TaxID=97084 RepID=A0A1Y5F858_9BACT|nr:hypothetical protein A9Q84_12310 [Halobacteriovorax marinus]